MTVTDAWIATTPVIELNGSNAADKFYDNLLEIRVEQELRLPGRAVLRFGDDGYALATDSNVTLGKRISVKAQPPDPTDRPDVLLVGVITGVAIEQSQRGRPELVLTAHDNAYKLTRGTRVGTFVNTSYSDIVTRIAGSHGLSPQVSAPSGNIDFLMQAESDIALLNALADRIGYDWWVDDETLHFAAPDANPRARGIPWELVLGKNLVEFSVRATGLRSDKFQVNGYDRKAQQLVSSTKTISSGVNQPDSDLAASFKQPGDNLNGTAELLTTDVGAQSVDETALIASALSNQAVAAGVSAVGVVLDGTALMPGEKVKVVDAGPTSGHYHVTKVEHVYRDEFRTRIFSGERRPLSLVDTLSGAQGSAVAAPLRHYGLVVGKVTNINDDEKSGRVKVTYPGVSPLQETSWARVLCLGAGPKRGAVVLPRVDDEVLIGFEGGDINQPVVLGGLYGSKSTIPLWDVDGSGTLAGWRTTSDLGHVIEIKDGSEPDKQYILLQLAGEKHLVKLGKTKAEVTVPNGVPVEINAGENASIKIDGSGNLTIKAVNIKMEATGNFEVKGLAVKQSSDSTFDLEGAMMSAKSKGTFQLEATGPLTAKGMPVAIN